ncbi:TPA: restriction endonuclease [Vibrio parahaemolyticus]
MQSIKKTPEWRQYEWLITKIMHDEYSSARTTVLNDTKLIGEYSERSRQIDILLETDTGKTIIECKHYSSPVDVKAAESFMSMMNDVQADFGIMVSSSGFTSSVPRRIREFEGRISLEQLDWQHAYETSFAADSYGRITDICSNCLSHYVKGKEVPGLLCWEHGIALLVEGKVSIASVGKCLKCFSHTVYCDSCGCISIAEHDEPCCDLRDVFFEFRASET